MTSLNEPVSVHIWDLEENYSGKEAILLWNRRSEKDKNKSIIKYIEDNKEVLRSLYLKYIHDLGTMAVGGKNLIEYFDIGESFSYWWMTSMVEKNPWKNPRIYEILKVFAFLHLIDGKKIKVIHLSTKDKDLYQIIKSIAETLKVKFIAEIIIHRQFIPSFLRVNYQISAIINLIRFIKFKLIFFFNIPSKSWQSSDSIFFCSFFDNFDIFKDNQKKGFFSSNYWGNLPLYIESEGISQNWAQLFIPNVKTPNPKAGINCLKEINTTSKKSTHRFVEEFLSFSIIFKALKNWVKLNRKVFLLSSNNKNKFFDYGKKNFSFWELYKYDFYESLIGTTSIQNCIWVELFKKLMKELPFQKKGFFLSENLPLEKALISEWKKNNHGDLISVLHGPNLRFWDMQDLFDKRTFTNKKHEIIPFANKVAVNNSKIKKEYLKFIPEEKIIELEALRYLWLDKRVQAHKEILNNTVRALILGDYLFDFTENLLETVLESRDLINVKIKFSFKAHYNQTMEHIDFGQYDINIEKRSLELAFEDYDLVITGNMTYASLDGYMSGIPVAVMLRKDMINMSPLEEDMAYFFEDHNQLSTFLNTLKLNKSPNLSKRDQILYIDKNMPKWKAFLKN